jgi:hypothetical protein
MNRLPQWRVAAYLGLGGVIACGSSGGDRELGGMWHLVADTVRSDIDGRVRYTATVTGFGREGPEGKPRTAAVMLMLSCGEGPPGLSLSTDQRLGQGVIDARVRADSVPAFTTPGFAGSSSRSSLVLFTDMKGLLDKLAGRRRALVEYSDPATSRKTIAECDVTPLDSLRRQYDAVCAGNLSR